MRWLTPASRNLAASNFVLVRRVGDDPGPFIEQPCVGNDYATAVSAKGATTSGLTPQVWLTVKKFWMIYFAAAVRGACRVSL